VPDTPSTRKKKRNYGLPGKNLPGFRRKGKEADRQGGDSAEGDSRPGDVGENGGSVNLRDIELSKKKRKISRREKKPTAICPRTSKGGEFSI